MDLTRIPAAVNACSVCSSAAVHSLSLFVYNNNTLCHLRLLANCTTTMLRACGSLHIKGCGRCRAFAAAVTLLQTVDPGLPVDTTPPPAPSALKALRVTLVSQLIPQVSTNVTINNYVFPGHQKRNFKYFGQILIYLHN